MKKEPITDKDLCLRLPLITKYFEMTKAGIKTEDYREITPYWCNRLALLNGKKLKKENWRGYLLYSGKLYMKLCSNPKMPVNSVEFQKFEENTMTLGYPKSTDTERILNYEHKGIEIRTGNPEWGAVKGKLYFVIMHGRLLS